MRRAVRGRLSCPGCNLDESLARQQHSLDRDFARKILTLLSKNGPFRSRLGAVAAAAGNGPQLRLKQRPLRVGDRN